MSGYRFSAVPWQAAEDDRLTELQLRVLIMIGKSASPTGWCFPYQTEIAKRLGCTPKAVCTSIRQLCDLNYLEKVHAADLKREKDAPKLNNNAKLYRVVLDRPEKPVLTSKGYDGINPCGADHNTTPLTTPDSSVPNGTGAKAPPSNEKREEHYSPAEPSNRERVWGLGMEILQNNKHRSFLGKLLKQCGGGEEGAGVLLPILKACKASGTRDPVPYLTVAVNNQCPPEEVVEHPSPKTFTREKWEKVANFAVRRVHDADVDAETCKLFFEEWDKGVYGPKPGTKGCLVPKDLQTPELLAVFGESGPLL